MWRVLRFGQFLIASSGMAWYEDETLLPLSLPAVGCSDCDLYASLHGLDTGRKVVSWREAADRVRVQRGGR
ncbi:hypothetical protein MUK42_36089 [Musa troglodytarum]|uniref:Uncharacterized protein n=1 Tax=Musa troglodytarum TaxID=320322 RepID=A0A9E7HJ39_9LILI|nr:hypothetical protein MUK42_15973 [Musa troglodytarum]URE37768.1 hypothetical protein MUK42_36089 [Musa troglodytarum]